MILLSSMIIVLGLIIVDKKIIIPIISICTILLCFGFILLLCTGLVQASIYNGDARNVAPDKSPFYWQNFGQPITDSAITTLTFGWGKASGDDLTAGLFYPVKKWEIEVCAAGITSDLNNAGSNVDLTGTSTDASMIYGEFTASLNAQKYDYSANYTLYEIGWYIQPRDIDIQYNVYITNGKNKYYLTNSLPSAPTDGTIIFTSDHVQGDAGYFEKYLSENYTTAVIEYPKGKVFMTTPILVNPYGARYS